MIFHVCICTCPAPGALPPRQHRSFGASMENAQLSKECGTQGGMVPAVSISQANLIPSYRLS